MSTRPMSAHERDILNEIRLAASATGMTTWRNNVGTGWTGEVIRVKAGSIVRVREDAILIHNPRPLHAGLCKGSSDLIGIRPVVVTAEMLGQTLAQFAAVEVKSSRGRVTEVQDRFLQFVRSAGGYAVIARSAEDLV